MQILNVIFTVIQFSMRIEKLPKEHREMASFWIDYANRNREVLLNGEFKAYEPQNCYPVVKMENEKEAIIAVYQVGKVIPLEKKKKTTVISANTSGEIIVDVRTTQQYKYKVYDCRGGLVKAGMIHVNHEMVRISVPQSGLCVLEEKADIL